MMEGDCWKTGGRVDRWRDDGGRLLEDRRES